MSRKDLRASLVLIAATLVLSGVFVWAQQRPSLKNDRVSAGRSETQFRSLGPSLFTIEVHSGNDDSKSSLGSGYLVSRDGLIVTNYHVVSDFIDQPKRYMLRAKNGDWEGPVELVRFDMFNDLALIRARDVEAQPLPLARALPAGGSHVTSFGNPEGLGLSVIEGVFNGLAEKGLVPRMLLSMPLNSGMSGGPILGEDGAVIGTNVSVMRDSNSLSFGVPVSKVHDLLARADVVDASPAKLRAELTRQLSEAEQQTTRRLIAALDASSKDPTVHVGGVAMRALPQLFECWDDSEDFKDEGIAQHEFNCNLDFSPELSDLGEVSGVWWTLENFSLKNPPRGRFGLFGFLPGHAKSHTTVESIAPRNGVTSAWECVADRVPFASRAWKVTTCVNAFVKHPGFATYELSATSLDEPTGASFVQIHARGFREASFLELSKRLLATLQ